MKKFAVLFAMAALILSTLACGSTGPNTLTIKNETQDMTVCYLYIASVESSEWGDDWLKGSTIPPGDSYEVEVPDGTYDLKVDDCDGNELATQTAMDFASGSVEWTLNQTP